MSILVKRCVRNKHFIELFMERKMWNRIYNYTLFPAYDTFITIKCQLNAKHSMSCIRVYLTKMLELQLGVVKNWLYIILPKKENLLFCQFIFYFFYFIFLFYLFYILYLSVRGMYITIPMLFSNKENMLTIKPKSRKS